MFGLSSSGQGKVYAALLLLICFGVGQPAWAASPFVFNNINDFTRLEDSAPRVIDLTNHFGGLGDTPITWSIVSNTNPALVTPTFAGNFMTLTWAPNGNGLATIRVRATDVDFDSISDIFTVTITPVDDSPVLVASPPPTIVGPYTASVAVDLSGMFSDADGDALTLSYVSDTNGALFSSAPTVVGTSLTLNFAPNQSGSSTITVAATDGSLSTTGTVDVTVTPNTAPTVALPIADVNATEDAPDLLIPLATVFSDPDIGDVLTYTVTSNDNPALVAATIGGSTLTLNYMPNASGVANISVEATDLGGLSVGDSFIVTVSTGNDSVVAVDDSVVMNEDDPTLPILVVANDIHPDGPVTITVAGITVTILGIDYPGSSESTPTTVRDASTGTDITLPNGAVVIIGNTIRYQPKTDYNGTDFFTYTIEDADGDSDTATVTVTVTPANDAPVQPGVLDYSVVQGTFLTVDPTGGLVSQGFDADGDTITVIQDTVAASIGLGFPGTTLSVSPDGEFTYTPDVAFVGTDSFGIRLFDGVAFSAPITVTIEVTPAPPPPPPPPPGVVGSGWNLADVPLEDAISAEANVLVIMDDSGSMDLAVMTDGDGGQFWITNGAVKQAAVPTFTNTYYYLVPLASNLSGNSNIMPTEEALAADVAFLGNNYGVWRASNSQFNTIYYNPKIEYRPWSGLDRNNVEFVNASPTAAPLDPYDAPIVTINLTTPLTFVSNNVPTVRAPSPTGRKNVTNTLYYIPRYYTTTAVGRPAWNDPHTLVKILNDGTTYVGGPNRNDCAAGDGDSLTCTYAQEIQNFANWFTYYRSREYTAKAALGRTVADVSNVRLGYVVLNDTNQRAVITSMNSSFRLGAKRTLMNQIYKIRSSGGTPLRVALDRAGKHFECRAGGSFGNPNTSPGDIRCPVAAAPEGQCQNNFALLFSDGTWNEAFSVGVHGAAANNNDVATNSPFDGGRYGDTRAATLADVAMYYYERDLHPSLINGVPTSPRDIAGASAGAFGGTGEVMHQHMTTYTVALGLQGLINPATIPANFATPFAWGNPFANGPAKVDDMMHAALNGRGQFLQANDPVFLSQALQSAFQEFSDGSVSVSAVAFNSTALRDQTVEYRGFFNLKFNTGEMKALNVDPTTGVVDTASPIWQAAVQLDGQVPTNRVIITYDRLADTGIPFRFADLNADHKLVLDANEVSWVRGDRSREEPAGTFRQRPLVEGLLGDIVHSAPQYVGTPRAIRRDQRPFPITDLYSAFKDATASREPLVYVAANDGMLHGFDALLGNERIGYVPNKLIDGSQTYRNALDRLMSLNYTHKFFVDVTPTLEDVYMPPRKGAVSKEWTTVLVGGLGGGGKGYYALNVTDPATDFGAETNAANNVLWEFTDQDDTYPVDNLGVPLGGAVGALLDASGLHIKDLGYSYSPAQVVMSNIGDGGSPIQQKWVAIFGNGYNSTAGIAKLFVVPIEHGLDGWQAGDVVKLDTGEGVRLAPDLLAGLPNGLGTPSVVDKDLNGTADVVYAGDQFGDLFRFDISNSNSALWTVTKLFQATYTSGTTVRQPITTAPYVIKHPTLPGYVVIFGTGSYFTEEDGVSTEIQSVYGIWDRGDLNPPTAISDTKSLRLVQQVVTNVVDETNPDFDHLRIVSANPVVYTPDAGAVPGTYGWYFDFVVTRPVLTLQGNPNPDVEGNAPPAVQYPGERAIRRFVPRGSSLLVTSVIPRDANTCFRSPPGATFPIDSLTGGNPTRPILDLNNDGVIDDTDFVTVGGVQYAAGILFDTTDLNGQLVDPSLLLGSGDGDFLFLSGGDEQITIRVAGPEDTKTGRLSWRELDNAN